MTTMPTSFADLRLLREAVDVEAKGAQGRDGRGELPGDFWPSYSALANTDGGLIALGVRERANGSLEPLGLAEVDRVRTNLWNLLNNPQKISTNLLTEGDVQVLQEGERSLLLVRVPRATRQQRPVYVGHNPLEGTYRRNHNGDYQCSPDEVRRMLAEAQGEGHPDSRILPHHGLEDLNADTLRTYRNAFKTAQPGHPYLDLDDLKLLQRLGGWQRNRETGEAGLTVAGLLMFADYEVIREVIPGYWLDYREEDPTQPDSVRWVDRLTMDGTWSGNVYDFYRLVYRRLVRDLRVPFRLRGGQRIDDTPVHEALREALANALSHGDYWGSGGVVVLKEPDGFNFKNPGTLRLPLDLVLEGGHTDPRNNAVHRMFLMVGAGERAGSGIPKILGAWDDQHWRSPNLTESVNPDTVTLRLTMQSLLPEEAVNGLQRRFGEDFNTLGHDARLALVTAEVEGFVTNERLQGITKLHSADITRLLGELTGRRLLQAEGIGRWTKYRLPTGQMELPLWTAVAEDVQQEQPLVQQGPSPVQQEQPPVQQEDPPATQQDGLGLGRRSVNREAVRQAILQVCRGEFLTLTELARRLNRSPQTLRTHYLPDLVASGELELLYPETPTRRGQAYRTRTQEHS